MCRTHRSSAAAVRRRLPCATVAYLIGTVAFVAILAGASDDSQQLDLCAPPDDRSPPSEADTTGVYPCVCSTAATQYSVIVNCQARSLNDTPFTYRHQLPAFTAQLDLSSNLLANAPDLIGDDLTKLDLGHNRIQLLYDRNFERCGARLAELSLAWNRIERISAHAFHGLGALQRLDLTKNHLARLAGNVFSPMPALRWLSVSRNRELNATFDGTTGVDLYLTLGVSTLLQTLQADECGLGDGLRLAGGVGLRELQLRYNRLERMPDVPRGLRLLDVSGNPLERLTAKSLPLLGDLEELRLQDMPNLTAVEAWSLEAVVPKLRVLSLAGSWRLQRFDALAFGWLPTGGAAWANGSVLVVGNLTTLDLSGTALTMINGTVPGARFTHMVARLQTLNVMGAPIRCDCAASWLLKAYVEHLLGECAQPAELHGRRLAELPEAALGCRWWPSWVYKLLNGLAILGMLAVCVTATWCLVTHIRPRSRRDRLQKVGDASPYARVTIEPTRGEL